MKRKMKLGIGICIVIDFCMALFLFLSYGPIDYFRELLITTAMTTKSHHYLARTLYDEKTIVAVMSQNYVGEIQDNTDTSHIKLEEIQEQEYYESKYEEQILKKEEGNDLYKLIPISGNSYKGHLVAIYDPTRIELVTSKYLGTSGQFLQQMSKENDAIVAMNASGFIDLNERGNGGTPTGRIIKDGKLIWTGKDTGYGGGLAGFTKDGILMLTHDTAENAIQKGLWDAVEFGPFLIVNGKKAPMQGNGGWGISSRTVLGQRQDGIVLFLVIDGRQPGYSLGASLVEVTNIMLRYKAYNAVNLDGGASSSLNINSKIVSKPSGISATGERMMPTAWIVK